MHFTIYKSLDTFGALDSLHHLRALLVAQLLVPHPHMLMVHLLQPLKHDAMCLVGWLDLKQFIHSLEWHTLGLGDQEESRTRLAWNQNIVVTE